MMEPINYTRIEQAIKFLIQHYKQQPSLEEIADHVGMSKFHFQRVFTEWAGVTPKQFVEHLTVEALKGEIRKTRNLIEASENVGLSAQSRAYDLMVKLEAMTPGEYKAMGKNLSITYGVAPSPFGETFVATTPRGVCAIEFVDNDLGAVLHSVQAQWEAATFLRCDETIKEIVDQIFVKNDRTLNLLLKGSPFQVKVWRALLSIPSGNIASYAEVAKMVEMDRAVRAVASAVAKNPIGYIIPCHRVIRSEGAVGQYHWRPERKQAIIGWELQQNNNKNT